MTEIKSNLYPCAHCSGQGVCRSGKEASSCAVCVQKNDLKKGEYVGLACGTCGGIGQAETVTERMNKRTQPLLAIGLMFAILIGLFLCAIFNSQYFNQVLAFSGTLLGTIVGFYFSHRPKN